MSTDAVRAALAELVACHTEEAGLTMSMVANRADFDAFMERCDQRLAAALDAARAALSAGDALRDGQAVPEGWQLVPKEPTDAMVDDGCEAIKGEHYTGTWGECGGVSWSESRAAYEAMLAAAPSPTIPAGQTRSQKLTAAGFTRRPSLWAMEAREALELIAAPMRPDGTWNRDREACRQLAAEALGRSEDTPTPLTERIVYPKIPPRKIQDDDEQPAPPEQHGELPEPSPEVVEAYLRANEEYWRRIDDEPMKLGKWRNGTVQEATAYALRTAIAAELERVRLEHARELVEAHREAFVGNIEALSKLDLDAMNAQPLLMAVQNWDISTGRARELLRCWVLGTFKPDMLPECGDELFAEADEPRDAWAKLQAELSTLRQQLAEAGRDAKRYRWLVHDHPTHEARAKVYEVAQWLNVRRKGHLDAAIDAAIEARGDAKLPHCT